MSINVNYHHAPRSNRLGVARDGCGGGGARAGVCVENAEEGRRSVSFGSDDDRADSGGGENGGDGDGDGVNAYLWFPGPTLTGSGDSGVGGEVDGEATLLLIVTASVVVVVVVEAHKCAHLYIWQVM
ncbi:hypothetical protein ABZP36_035260 [Zizania latifolia]